jgi:hypothetical protein
MDPVGAPLVPAIAAIVTPRAPRSNTTARAAFMIASSVWSCGRDIFSSVQILEHTP